MPRAAASSGMDVEVRLALGGAQALDIDKGRVEEVAAGGEIIASG
jgi:hypothetical protein